MEDRLSPALKAEIHAAVKVAVEETVNGRIKAIDTKLEAYMEKIEPYLKTAAGFKLSARFIYRLFLSMGAIAAAYIAIKGVFYGETIIKIN